MRVILVPILFAVLMACAATPCTGATQHDGKTSPQDTTLDVIGWFCNRDTITYWIQESDWKIHGVDTIQTAGISTKVRITVEDSTATGYRMDYTFLDVRGDSLADSELGNFQNKMASLLGSKIIGTTISYETDEYGRILKINNIGKIKKQAKSLFKEAVKEMGKLPWMKGLKEMGLDLTDYAKGIDSDLLVEGYVEELKLLFTCHGMSYDVGETTARNEATETHYANETYRSVAVDDDRSYSIVTDVKSTIPRSDIKTVMSGIVDGISDPGVKNDFDSNFDSQVKEDCTVDSYLKIAILPNGWPYEVIEQKTVMIGDKGKATQKYIYVESYSFYNH